jgi:Pyruvate/2-oxoacid:ferredoxin oxidoreductase delta subunit
MFGLVTASPPARRDYSDCSGCSLCFLVCPMWRASHDPRLTPEGIAKALQCGATASQLTAVLDACCLCGACDPVCPERIDLPAMIMELRRRSMNQSPPGQARPAILDKLQAVLQEDHGAPSAVAASAPLLMPGPDLRGDSTLLTRVQDLLGLAVVADDGADIALALEAGVEIPSARIDSFLATLRGHSIVVENGLLLRQLRRWIPGSQRIGLGAALNGRPALRARIGASDLYVIDARAYHADHERMVAYYDRLRIETGCTLNLDLQRIAIPATATGLSQKLGLAADDDGAQAKWILRGRQPTRIVVETLADRAAFQRVCDIPVVHLADLAQN